MEDLCSSNSICLYLSFGRYWKNITWADITVEKRWNVYCSAGFNLFVGEKIAPEADAFSVMSHNAMEHWKSKLSKLSTHSWPWLLLYLICNQEDPMAARSKSSKKRGASKEQEGKITVWKSAGSSDSRRTSGNVVEIRQRSWKVVASLINRWCGRWKGHPRA